MILHTHSQSFRPSHPHGTVQFTRRDQTSVVTSSGPKGIAEVVEINCLSSWRTRVSMDRGRARVVVVVVVSAHNAGAPKSSGGPGGVPASERASKGGVPTSVIARDSPLSSEPTERTVARYGPVFVKTGKAESPVSPKVSRDSKEATLRMLMPSGAAAGAPGPRTVAPVVALVSRSAGGSAPVIAASSGLSGVADSAEISLSSEGRYGLPLPRPRQVGSADRHRALRKCSKW